MRIYSSFAASGLVLACLLSAAVARADSTALADYVWDLPALSLGDCMQHASNALLQIGVKDVREQTPSNGLGFVGGPYGSYYLGVICFAAKGVVVTQAAGADFDTAERYRHQIDVIMGNRN